MLNYELTCDKHIIKQIFSCKSLGFMMLMEHIISSMEPIKILFDKNDVPITDLLVYLPELDSVKTNIRLYINHKNQL